MANKVQITQSHDTKRNAVEQRGLRQEERATAKAASRRTASPLPAAAAAPYLSFPPVERPQSGRLVGVWEDLISKVFDRIPGEKGPHICASKSIKHPNTNA